MAIAYTAVESDHAAVFNSSSRANAKLVPGILECQIILVAADTLAHKIHHMFRIFLQNKKQTVFVESKRFLLDWKLIFSAIFNRRIFFASYPAVGKNRLHQFKCEIPVT